MGKASTRLAIRVGKLVAKAVAWALETFLYKMLPLP